MASLRFPFLVMVAAGATGLAQPVLFTFDDARIHAPLPIDVTSGGIAAHLWADSPVYNYSVQFANVLGFTPIGFSGYCIYPNQVYKCDLAASFSVPLTEFSILYSVQELECDSSATMRVTAFMNGSFVGTATKVAVAGGVWPTATLAIATAQPFNKVIVHYDSPPPTGGDYGVIFMADNMWVTPAPDPCLGADFNADGAVNTLDVLGFLNSWNAHDAAADCDGNGVVDTRDVSCFLNLWVGCR